MLKITLAYKIISKKILISPHLLQKGQRVLCYRGDGGLYQDTVIVHEKYCFPIPDIISFQTAVAIPANYLTAYFCLFEFGNLRSGQTILLHSCAGKIINYIYFLYNYFQNFIFDHQMSATYKLCFYM